MTADGHKFLPPFGEAPSAGAITRNGQLRTMRRSADKEYAKCTVSSKKTSSQGGARYIAIR
jgi:hypothetical protein